MYRQGEGASQDYKQAHKWFNIAGANGSKKSSEKRDDIAKRMTANQIEQAQQLALEWIQKHWGCAIYYPYLLLFFFY